jgi:hypothetical protein
MRLSLFLVTIQLILKENLTLGYLPVEFDLNDAKDASNLRGLDFIGRFMVPYGPDVLSNPPQSNPDFPYAGYGYGMVGAGLGSRKNRSYMVI